jgi:hypothetical protein
MSGTWADTRARLGRNDLPAALATAVFEETLTSADEIAAGIAEAWQACEWPLQQMEASVWIWLFSQVLNPHQYLRRASIVSQIGLPPFTRLYRGAAPGHAEGMAWTTNRERANWYATRFAHREGHLYTIEAASHMVLARFPGYPDDEWVLNSALFEPGEVTLAA